MEALCIRIERRETQIGRTSQRKHIVVLLARLGEHDITLNLSQSMRPLLGMIRERNVRGLQATMPTAISVLAQGDGYVIAAHDLAWWAEQVREYHDRVTALPDHLRSS